MWLSYTHTHTHTHVLVCPVVSDWADTELVWLWDSVDCNSPGSSFHGFYRQEYWGGLSCPPPGDLPDPGINLQLLPWQVDSLPFETPIYLSIYLSIYIHTYIYIERERASEREREQAPHCEALDPWSGIKHMSPAVEAWSPNHAITIELPYVTFYRISLTCFSQTLENIQKQC